VTARFLTLLLVPLLLAPADQAVPRDVRFEWALGALTRPDGALVAIGRQAALKSGDRLKIFLRLKEPGFVYVILHDADNQITLLYPAALSSGDSAVGVPVYVPAGAEWMDLDDRAGIETIHLIASSTRLLKLEDALKEHLGTQPADRAAMARRVVDEIARAKKQFAPGAAVAERPVEMAGRVRGNPRDVASHAIEVSARHFYSRTITIDHR
jgi:hypothetical protein